MSEISIPTSLKNVQQLLAASVARPFEWDEDGFYSINTAYPQILTDSINENNGISSSERLKMYNRGYWYRLFTLMQKEMPLTVHLLGYGEFNRFAAEYLQQFPSDSQILNYLYDHMPEFIDMDHEWNTPLMSQAVNLEYCYTKAFDAQLRPPLDPAKMPVAELETLAERTLYLQPYVFLWEEDWNLMELRKVAAATNDDDLILKPDSIHSFWIIYRSLGNRINCEKLNDCQWRILQEFKQGQSLLQALEYAFEDLTEEETFKAGQHIQSWFNQWVSWGIFHLDN